MKLKINRMRAILIGLVAFIVIIGAAAWILFAVYVQRSDNPIVRQVGSWLPAAKIGTHTVTYGDFLDMRDTLKVFLNSDAAKQAGSAQPLTPDVEKQGLQSLLRDIAVADMADQRNVTVSDDDVRTDFAAIIAANSSTIPDVGQYLHDNYNWTEEQFRQKVLRPAILQERVAATYSTDTQEQYVMMESAVGQRMADPDVKIYLKFDQ